MGDVGEERKRLKTLAIKNRLLSSTPARCASSLKPTKQILKHHGSDIIRKSQRKNRFLFSLPGLLAPISGATIGDLDRLSTKNPILYINFPQGRMKLFGTIVYPKTRYLTLQFSKGGKNVTCDDYFDNMIVFSEAWWIGTKEENPEEARLDFPQELAQLGQQTEIDFRGGAGGGARASASASAVSPKVQAFPEPDSPETEMQDDSSDKDGLEDKIQVTPVRTSLRNSGKKFNFAEVSPEDSSHPSNENSSSEEENEKPLPEPNSSTVGVCDKLQADGAGTRKQKSKGADGPLVQATLASLFKKAEVKASASCK